MLSETNHNNNTYGKFSKIYFIEKIKLSKFRSYNLDKTCNREIWPIKNRRCIFCEQDYIEGWVERKSYNTMNLEKLSSEKMFTASDLGTLFINSPCNRVTNDLGYPGQTELTVSIWHGRDWFLMTHGKTSSESELLRVYVLYDVGDFNLYSTFINEFLTRLISSERINESKQMLIAGSRA